MTPSDQDPLPVAELVHKPIGFRVRYGLRGFKKLKSYILPLIVICTVFGATYGFAILAMKTKQARSEYFQRQMSVFQDSCLSNDHAHFSCADGGMFEGPTCTCDIDGITVTTLHLE